MNEIAGEYDIIIVGAGLSGCSVGCFLNEDYRVLIIDQSVFPMDKSCGGLLTKESKDFLSNILKVNLPNSVFSNPKEVSIRHIDWENALKIVQPMTVWNINRLKFNNFIFNQLKNNITFLPRTKLIHFEKKENGIRVLIKRNDKKTIINSRILIGAQGPNSSIRRTITDKKLSTYITFQEWVPNGDKIDTVDFIFCNEITDFYSWRIPKRDKLIIGTAINLDEKTVKKLELLKTRFLKQGYSYNKSIKKESALIARPKTKFEIMLGVDNILLVGESAGLISPISGEGISYALRSGYYCASILNEDLRNPLRKYAEYCQPLIDEIDKKSEKAKALSDVIKRKNIFLKWSDCRYNGNGGEV